MLLSFRAPPRGRLSPARACVLSPFIGASRYASATPAFAFATSHAVTGIEIESGRSPTDESGPHPRAAASIGPEQARGAADDHRSDILSFEVVVFEMLSERQLFEGETAPDILTSVLARE